MTSTLPIHEVVTDIQRALTQRDELVLEAPPGAGKTTWVPLALRNESWLGNHIIVMLEPRRVAARNAALRMAQLLNEKVGDTVGYRIRHENKVGKNTKIIVVTEGVLTRWLQNDPSLDGVGLVIFDEFHERNLDSDLGLALCLQARALFRDEQSLKLLIMSATLDGERLSTFLNNAPLVRSAGRSYPVDIQYSNQHCHRNKNNTQALIYAVTHALNESKGSVLVFLPGKREIEQLANALQKSTANNIAIYKLHGSLNIEQQNQAIGPVDRARYARKIVLATDVAETSLTIDDISIVVDSGLNRVAVYDPNTAMTRLNTQRISKAAAEQRAGRAGRTGPGKALRLWPEAEENQFIKHRQPEILNADLSSFALQLFQWGIFDPQELQLLDPAPTGVFDQATDLLLQLGALATGSNNESDRNYQLTPHGKAMAELPSHPRLAHMLLCASGSNYKDLACELAALLNERDPINQGSVDIERRLSLLKLSDTTLHKSPHKNSTKPHFDLNASNSVTQWRQRIKKQKQQFQNLLRTNGKNTANSNTANSNTVNSNNTNKKHTSETHMSGVEDGDAVPYLLVCAFPDRIAKKNAHLNTYKLSNGRTAALKDDDLLCNEDWLIVADIGGHSGTNTDRIYLAHALPRNLLTTDFDNMIETRTKAQWDKSAERFVAEEYTSIGKLVIEKKRLKHVDDTIKTSAITDYIKTGSLSILNWSNDSKQFCARVNLVGNALNKNKDRDNNTKNSSPQIKQWPNLSFQHLEQTCDTWLTPYLNNINTLRDLKKIDLLNALKSMLSWEQLKELDTLAPLFFNAPSGSNIRIDYEQNPPVLAVKLQEIFGLLDTPRLVNNQIPVTIHLLSPARRPLQITQDLRHFWTHSYHEVKKDMKGRYPKHPWPDDPLNAEATRYAKPRRIKK